MFSKISAWLFRLWGWKATGQYSYDVKKLVMIVAPHTSNWDFPVGVLVRSALEIDCYFVAKHTVFWGPLGPIMRWLRGIPVNRGKKSNFVEATAALFKTREQLHILLAPEGTRSCCVPSIGLNGRFILIQYYFIQHRMKRLIWNTCGIIIKM
jgi:1-acyl-sn-glycerol-3-phosphate acyltransferase